MNSQPRRLPVDFAHFHSPRSALTAVYAAHVAYPSTVIAALLTFVAESPPDGSVLAAWLIATTAWTAFIVSFLHSHRLGPSRVWRTGHQLEALVTSTLATPTGIDARVRFSCDGLTHIATVSVPTSRWPETDPETLTIAFLPHHPPIFMAVPEPYAAVRSA